MVDPRRIWLWMLSVKVCFLPVRAFRRRSGTPALSYASLNWISIWPRLTHDVGFSRSAGGQMVPGFMMRQSLAKWLRSYWMRGRGCWHSAAGAVWFSGQLSIASPAARVRSDPVLVFFTSQQGISVPSASVPANQIKSNQKHIYIVLYVAISESEALDGDD